MNGPQFIRLAHRVRDAIGQKHRYRHTLGVARLAEKLARRHGEGPLRARLAGMLHDLARLFPPQRLLEECERRRLPIDDFDRAHPTVLHARISAELARELFGIDDERVLSAIRAHTLGNGSMSRLDTILFLADALEPGRDFADREQLERLAFTDLEEAMRATLQSTLTYLSERGLTIAPATREAIRQFAAKEKSTA